MIKSSSFDKKISSSRLSEILNQFVLSNQDSISLNLLKCKFTHSFLKAKHFHNMENNVILHDLTYKKSSVNVCQKSFETSPQVSWMLFDKRE